MNFVNTLIVDGQSYIVQDPNAVTQEQLADTLSKLPGNDSSWKVVAETTLTENQEAVSILSWDYPSETVTMEELKRMSEFKLMVRLPFTEDIPANKFTISAIIYDLRTNNGFTLFAPYNIECKGGTPEAPKTIIFNAIITKMDTWLVSMYRQALSTNDVAQVSSGHKDCKNDKVNLFDVERWRLRVRLLTHPFPAGTRILWEGR